MFLELCVEQGQSDSHEVLGGLKVFGLFWAAVHEVAGDVSEDESLAFSLSFMEPVFGLIRPRQAKSSGSARLFRQKGRVTCGQGGETVVLKSGVKTLVWSFGCSAPTKGQTSHSAAAHRFLRV